MSFKADSPTFTGAVAVPNPTNPTDAAPRGYVDAADGKVRRGTAAFTDEAAKAVVLNPAFPDANYRIALAPDGNVAAWYSNKAAGGFTINTSANLTGNVDWIAAHD
jgi:hypothetical protein